ncbi:MAG TPA: helicase-related protein, partial [Candidatus Norongarragalinales archaeon]|nr:helicase-related protein [Candidatus Norongarragalinales archaeon]
ARDLCKVTSAYLTDEEKQDCLALSTKAKKSLMHPTEQCHKLADCIAQGVAFHHAGLDGKQKEVVELGFKKHRAIKLIVATTTLAVGLDLPASWVIVRDLKRFNGAYSEFLTKMECLQMAGRAGRPRYDDKGVAVLVCGRGELRKVRDKYVFGELEDVYSQLSAEPSLRTHALGLCASSYSKSFEDVFTFFQSTFYAHQYKDAQKLLSGVEKVVLELQTLDFLREKNGKLFATPLGKRVSELYLDPLSASTFLESMKKPLNEFSFLMALQKASESRPLLNIKRDEERSLWEEWFAQTEGEDDEEALQRFKTAKFFNAWINEATEDEILKTFDIPPGVLHAKVRIQDWLTYSFGELAFLENRVTAHGFARKMRRRMLHGIKEELLPLLRRGIGRVRARRLFNAGVRTKEALDALDKDQVQKIVRSKEEAFKPEE